jgi:peroxiredoxin
MSNKKFVLDPNINQLVKKSPLINKDPMRNYLSLTILLFHFTATAQQEQLAVLELQRLNDSIDVIYKDSIHYYRGRNEKGDTTILDAWSNIVDKYRDARTEIYKIIIHRFPNTATAAENFHWFYFEVPFDTLLGLYNKLGPIALAHENGQHAASFVERAKKLQPGMMAPDFMQPDTEGKPVNLRDFKGKILLLEFWANWCKPCRAENPNIKAAYVKYQTHGFEVIGISMDKESDKEKWLKAITEDKLIWPQVSDLKGFGNEAFLLFNVMPIPDNYLIDRQGKIIARGLHGEKLNETLAKLFGF